MLEINDDTLADIAFDLYYESPAGKHHDHYWAAGVNFWRDYFPPKLHLALLKKTTGDIIHLKAPPGKWVPPHTSTDVRLIDKTCFNGSAPPAPMLQPRAGRFYPTGLLTGIPAVFPQNIKPFRCMSVGPANMVIDMNHALAQIELTLQAKIRQIRPKKTERGGTCRVWLDEIADGPGMQSRANGQPTDFFTSPAFTRIDENPDTDFYARPRLVQHIDECARQLIAQLYGRLIRPRADVLDLMSSWVSHLPPDLNPASLTGLGLNNAELTANKDLTAYVVHDLNRNPRLPFGSACFDAVVCTVSVEYLTHPFSVFDEVARVLRAGGIFIVTFSDRWFEPKVIEIWTQLHMFERMGLVLEYFLKNNRFTKCHTYSARGYPRPAKDKYYPARPLADPVFAVWGARI